MIDRPSTWIPDYSDTINFTDYTGVVRSVTKAERDKKRYQEMREAFRERFFNQQPKRGGPSFETARQETLITIEQYNL